jgi:hypothetical protein
MVMWFFLTYVRHWPVDCDTSSASFCGTKDRPGIGPEAKRH